jgi:hypothetical protein
MAALIIARTPGQCAECGCRYRPGEMVMEAEDGAFHSDCFRTRGSYALRAYEDQQPVELDLLLIAIHNEGVSSELSPNR